MAALDVRVNLYKDGVLVNSGGGSGGVIDDDTAVLGKAKLGKMKLGKS